MMTDTTKIAGYDHAPGNDREASPPDGAAQVPASSAPELKSLLAVAVGTLIVAALYFGKDVLIPITLAVMLSFVLSPVVSLLQRLRLWRAPAVIITVLAALAVLGLIGTVIGSQGASLAAKAPDYVKTIQQKVAGVQGFAIEKLGSISKEFGGGSKAGTQGKTAPSLAAPSGGARPPVPVEIQGSTSPLSVARAVVEPILGPLETTILVFIVAIFVMMQKEDLRDRFIRLFGSNDLHRTTRAMDDAGQRLGKYFLSQLAVNTCFGVVIGFGLWMIGIPASAMWGLMAGLLRFVPYIGSLLAAVAPAALGAAVDPGWTMAIEVIALFFVVEPLTGYVVEPLLYGHSTGLSPISVIVAAIFWTWVWGPIGLIMSTPLTLCLVVLGKHVKSLEFFDIMLGDRPALTPVETFYQRILADNPDEVLAQAEAFLADKPLLAYYDAVVLPSLRLAAEDAARGTIDRPRAKEMIGSMMSVIDDLRVQGEPGQGEDQPATLAAEGMRIVCVAGRGQFDPVITAMLGQVLARSGAAARTIANAQVARHAVASLDLDGIDVIAIAYLDLAPSSAELRYLVKRLRERAPSAAIIIGLRPDDGATSPNTEMLRQAGGDTFASTLGEFVDAIVAARPSLEQNAA